MAPINLLSVLEVSEVYSGFGASWSLRLPLKSCELFLWWGDAGGTKGLDCKRPARDGRACEKRALASASSLASFCSAETEGVKVGVASESCGAAACVKLGWKALAPRESEGWPI